MHRLARPLMTVLVLALVSCAGVPNKSRPLPAFEKIELTAGGEVKEDLQADSAAKIASDGALSGAASGAAAGAVVGVYCGPMAFACVPVMAMWGAVGGAVAGGISKKQSSLTEVHRQQVNDVLEKMNAGVDFNQMLLQSLSDALPDDLEATQPDAEALVHVQVKSLELRLFTGERISLNINAEMKTSWGADDKASTRQTNRYQYETAQEAVAYWLDNEGQGFERGIAQCVNRIAAYMARDLAQPGEIALD